MSNSKRSESPSRSPLTSETPKSKRVRQKRSGKASKSEGLTPIGKYLIKEEAPCDEPAASRSTESSCRGGKDPENSTGTSSTTSVRKNQQNAGTSQVESEPVNPSIEPSLTDSEGGERKTVTGVTMSIKKEKRGGGGGGGGGREGGRRTRTRRPVEPQTSSSTPSPNRRQVQSSIRDHFPVRRSGRKTKSEIEKEEFEKMAQRLRNKDESGLQIVDVEGKGRGVVSSRPFSRGELLCEYSGELITVEEAKRREEKYSNDTTIGCYMYYFSHKNTKLCVDATADNGRKGRLLNHSRTAANVVTKLLEVDSRPYLCLMASRDIATGEQLEYDYGERDKAAMDSHPWLAT